MLGKILLTLVVILIAALFIKQRREAARERDARLRQASEQQSQGNWQQKSSKMTNLERLEARQPDGVDYRLIAYGFLAVLAILAAALYYQSWRDARQTVTVLLHRDGSSAPVIYQVEKRHLSERSFITVDGTRVSVSANERMEIVGL